MPNTKNVSTNKEAISDYNIDAKWAMLNFDTIKFNGTSWVFKTNTATYILPNSIYAGMNALAHGLTRHMTVTVSMPKATGMVIAESSNLVKAYNLFRFIILKCETEYLNKKAKPKSEPEPELTDDDIDSMDLDI